jgi:signal transduction histidine kinase
VNLLDWARSQTGRLKFKPQKIDLSELVTENIEFIENTAAKKNIQLENYLKEELFVIADKNTINTVIRNLLQNAVKYSNKNGTVKVYSEPAKSNDYINICVEDNGIGISPEHIDKLFRIDENYSTLGTNDEKGTGLGLVLCKEFVEKNGGSIKVDSVYEQGTTIRFSLKRA